MDEKEKKIQTRKIPKKGDGFSSDPIKEDTREIRHHNFSKDEAKGSSMSRPIKSTNYAIILITVVFVSVLVAVFIFATMLGNSNSREAVGGGNNQPPAQNGNQNQLPTTTLPDEESTQQIGLIQGIHNNRIDVYVFETGESLSFFVADDSNLRDRFNNVVILSQFTIGDVVEIGHEAGSTTIDTARLSPQVRFYRNISHVVVEGSYLVIGNTRYNISHNPIVHYGENRLQLADIDPINTVSIGVFQDSFVTSIDVHISHGYVNIPANPNIAGGYVEVAGTRHPLPSEGQLTLSISTQERQITIYGENIEPFVVDVSISRGSTTTIATADVESIRGSVTFRGTPASLNPISTITIAGQTHPAEETIYLPLGTYDFTITAPGYLPYSSTLEITNQPRDFVFSLTQETPDPPEQQPPQIIARSVFISTTPAEARVYISNIFVGNTPLNVNLELGQYELRMELPGHFTLNTSIFITEDGSTIFTFPLTPNPLG